MSAGGEPLPPKAPPQRFELSTIKREPTIESIMYPGFDKAAVQALRQAGVQNLDELRDLPFDQFKTTLKTQGVVNTFDQWDYHNIQNDARLILVQERVEYMAPFDIGGKKYTIEKYLDSGIFGKAYLAKCGDETVVVKIAHRTLDDKARAVFLEEPENLLQMTAYQQEHNLLVSGKPLTPEMIGVGSIERSRPYIAMTFAQGESLDGIADKAYHGESVLSPRQIGVIGEQFCRVMVALHEGLQKSLYDYQDKKIIWDAENARITVIDWNLLAPLTVRLGREVDMDPAEDLFRFCQTMYLLSTGEVYKDYIPVRSEVGRHVTDTALINILSKGLHKNQKERYQTAEEMRVDFVYLMRNGEEEKLSHMVRVADSQGYSDRHTSDYYPLPRRPRPDSDDLWLNQRIAQGYVETHSND